MIATSTFIKQQQIAVGREGDIGGRFDELDAIAAHQDIARGAELAAQAAAAAGETGRLVGPVDLVHHRAFTPDAQVVGGGHADDAAADDSDGHAASNGSRTPPASMAAGLITCPSAVGMIPRRWGRCRDQQVAGHSGGVAVSPSVRRSFWLKKQR